MCPSELGIHVVLYATAFLHMSLLRFSLRPDGADVVVVTVMFDADSVNKQGRI